MATLKLFLFGSPRLERNGVGVKIPRRKALALLIYLATTGKTHARDSLATLFWPDHAQREARLALSRHLSELNKSLGSDMLVLEPESVALHGDVWLDVADFEATIAAYPHATRDSLSMLQAAVDLYGDDFLAGFTLPGCPDFDDWQAFKAESLRQSLRMALAEASTAQAGMHDYANAIATARRWLALDSLEEAAHRTLMQLFAHSGQQGAALRQYEQCRQILADELGVPPAAETTDLYQRIHRGELRQREQKSTPAAEPTRVSHSPSADPIVIHNLPAQTAPFIGREVELAEVTRLLISPEVRLLTIVGQGGMGKTRLARQSGRRLLNHFPDGVWYLSLAAVDRDTFGPALNPLLNGLAGALGITLRSASTAEEQILAHLHDRRLLLILDNLEHLLESSTVISALVSGAGGITVLTTSRERLNLQEEWLFPLAGLTLPAVEVEETASSANTEAMQLFTQVAQRVQPTFDPQRAWRAVAEICRLVEGMPLGIELAASWVRYMTPAAIAQEIEGDIDFLATNVRNLPARHRSLRAVFDHSWRLLSAEEQAVLPRLAVFRGGFRPAEAQVVTGASQVVLAALVDKSLLAVAADGRYELHERLRQYLLDKLRQNLSVYQVTNDRHSQVYLAMLQLGPAELARQTALQRLTEDFDNLRAAWSWAIDHDHWSAIRRARRGLHFFCLNKSWLLEENEFYARTISRLKHRLAQPGVPPEAEREPEMPLLLATLQCHHSETQGRLGIHDPTRQTMLDDHLDILRALGPTAYPELVEVLTGAIFPHRRRLVDGHEAQRRYSLEALTLCRSLGDGFGQHLALQGLGFAALFAGQFEEVARYADQLISLAQTVGSALYAGLSLRGHLAIAQGDYPQAEEYILRCHHLVVNIDPRFPAIPFFCAALANIARLLGDFAQATAYLQQATTLEQTLGHGHPEGFRHHRHHEVLLVSGYLAAAQGFLPPAQEAFAEIWQQDQGQSHYSSAALIGLGWVAVQQEDWSTARRHFAAALPLIVQLQTAPQALECLAGLAHVEAQTGQLEAALAMVILVLHHPSTFQETNARLTELHARLVAALPPATVEAVRASGMTSQLWTDTADLLIKLT